MQPRLDAFATAPELIQPMLAMENAVKKSGLELGLIELIKLRVSQINGCAYCVHMHTNDARRMGESEDRLHLLTAWRESPLYSDRERAALAWAETLTRIMDKDFTHILTSYDRAVIGDYSGSIQAIGREAVNRFWIGLRSSFPNATSKIHHQIGMDDTMMSPRAAIRWSLDGTHDGWGAFGRPTGAKVHVMSMSHAEFGPWGLRREYCYYDEVAIWKQILLQTGDF